jgi:hypothetical protein
MIKALEAKSSGSALSGKEVTLRDKEGLAIVYIYIFPPDRKFVLSNDLGNDCWCIP